MRYLTKSRFKLGLECPTKMFYNIHSSVYHDEKSDNDFLQALAKGGFQVGELAKLYYSDLPNTHVYDIDTIDLDEAIKRTEEALVNDEVVIFEAAIQVGFKLIRVDILHKTSGKIRLLEVKSKSGIGKDPDQFFGARGGVDSAWRSYLEDVIFQKFVVQDYLEKNNIDMPVRPFLMVPDKLKVASIDGLHEKFILKENESGRHYCEPINGLTSEGIGEKIMSEIFVSDDTIAKLIEDEKYNSDKYPVNGFENIIEHFEVVVEAYNGDHDQVQVEYSKPGRKCKDCTFRTSLHKPTKKGKVSGFSRCMKSQLHWNDDQLNQLKSFDVWNFQSDSVIKEGRWFMSELNMSDFDTSKESCSEPIIGDGISNVQRKWLQVDRSNMNKGEYIDLELLKDMIKECTPPYHFIDFETIAPAIPFFKGYKPFQGFAFQFSHHILNGNKLEHKTQYIGEGQGINPFDDFIFKLYDALRHDKGTIFMYSSHENTFVNNAIVYLLNGQSKFDDEMVKTLVKFYQTISKPTEKNSKQDFAWEKSDRMMVDLREIVMKTYWHPIMGGSNSIKKVLPAVLNASEHLKSKYSQPIYGGDGIPSFNFKNGKTWVEYFDNDKVKDPYDLLPNLNDIFGEDMQSIDILFADEKIGNGGAAMTAWSYMQFAHMTNKERDAITEALKMYCELDTLAMVFIWEYFQSMVK